MKKRKTWDDISIGQYERILEEVDKGETIRQKTARLQSVVLGIPYEELLNKKLSEVGKLWEPYLAIDMSHIPKKRRKQWDGFSIVYDIEDATGGQAVDLDTVISSPEKGLSDFMAVLCNRSDMTNFDDRKEYLRDNMPITLALGTYDFFLRRMSRWQRLFPKYLGWLMLKTKWRMNLLRLRIRLNRLSGGLFGSRG